MTGSKIPPKSQSKKNVEESEASRLHKTASVYHSDSLAGTNEKYHLHLRDTLIPADGGRSALELGCGKGLWTEALCRLYDQVDVVDGSLELLRKVARFANLRAHLSTHEALAEDFLETCPKVWQHIYITFLLEHLADPEAVLQMAHKRLARDGMLMAAVPNAESVHRVLALRAGLIQSLDELSENDIRVGHRRVYTRRLLQEHLLSAGFRIAQEKPIGLKPFSLKQLEELPVPVIEALCASGDLAPDNAAYLAVIVRPK